MLNIAAALLLGTVPIEETDITAAVEACIGVETLMSGALDSSDFDVLDGGHSVVMDRLDHGFDAYDCVRSELGLPEWTFEAMLHTTSQAGLLTLELDGYTAIWSYHPENGPFVVLHDDEA